MSKLFVPFITSAIALGIGVAIGYASAPEPTAVQIDTAAFHTGFDRGFTTGAAWMQFQIQRQQEQQNRSGGLHPNQFEARKAIEGIYALDGANC